MTAYAAIELQQVVYGILSADAQLASLVDGVFDYLPEAQAGIAEYVELGELEGAYSDDKDNGAMEWRFTVHTWTRASRGKADCLRVQQRIYDLLHNQITATSSQQVTVCIEEMATSMRDPDGITTHGVQRFLFITHPH